MALDHESDPADAVSLRSVSSDNFVVVDTTDEATVIGDVDFASATSTRHEKAIDIVEGAQYQVEGLDIKGSKADVRRVDCDYDTDAIGICWRRAASPMSRSSASASVIPRIVGRWSIASSVSIESWERRGLAVSSGGWSGAGLPTLIGLLLPAALNGHGAELLGEPLDATLGVDELLLAGEEGMAVGADLQAQVGHGRPRLPCRAAGAAHVNLVVVRMNPCFHRLFLPTV